MGETEGLAPFHACFVFGGSLQFVKQDILSSMQIGIIGLPNVGKSTLFNALLKRQKALVANYPFATIEPNVGVVDVPDKRLSKLVEMHAPKSVVPAVVKFVDIAGLVKGASEGIGLGNQFLAHIRDADAIIHVLRVFDDSDVFRSGSAGWQDDEKVVNTELVLADIQSLQKQVDRLQKLARGNDKESFSRLKLCEKLLNALDGGETPGSLDLTENEGPLLADFHLLTSKPVLRVFNVSEDQIKSGKLAEFEASGVVVCAKVEADLAIFSSEEVEALGVAATGLDKVIKSGYALLGLRTFFTAGEKEVRAWTIKAGTKAPQAAGIIHTDFERGFIAAEVAAFENLAAAGGWKEAREKGLVRIEGRDYVIRDGDVVVFRFSV